VVCATYLLYLRCQIVEYIEECCEEYRSHQNPLVACKSNNGKLACVCHLAWTRVAHLIESLYARVLHLHFGHWKLVASIAISGILQVSYSRALHSVDEVLTLVSSNGAPEDLMVRVRSVNDSQVSRLFTMKSLTERHDVAHALTTSRTRCLITAGLLAVFVVVHVLPVSGTETATLEGIDVIARIA
jgi:hypothetical protein